MARSQHVTVLETLLLFVVFLALVASSEFEDAVIRAQCQAECLHKVSLNNIRPTPHNTRRVVEVIRCNVDPLYMFELGV